MEKSVVKNEEKPEGFKGHFTNLNLTDLIQLSARGRMDLVLHITQDQKAGKIYIKEGEIIHAACDDLTGIEAFYEIMSLKRGEFHVGDFAPPPTQSISLPWEHLLIEAHRWMDEHQKLSDKEAPLNVRELEAKLAEALQEWGSFHPDVAEIGMLSLEDITTIYQRDDTPIAKKGLELLRTNIRLSEILSQTLECGTCDEILIEGQKGVILLYFFTPIIQIYTRIDADISQKAILIVEINEFMEKLKTDFQLEA